MSGVADIVVLTTGGTIDKVYTITGELEVGPPAAQRLLGLLTTNQRFEVRSVLAKDSSDMTEVDREMVASALGDVETSSVVITHGTDTLTATAEYLDHHPSAEGKIVALTGALQPAAMTLSDAAVNFGVALMACQSLPPGVYVCMGGRAFPAGQVAKDGSTGHFVSKPPDPGSDPPE